MKSELTTHETFYILILILIFTEKMYSDMSYITLEIVSVDPQKRHTK